MVSAAAHRPLVESSDLLAFERILEQVPAGEQVSIEHLRTDLEALQVRPSQYGSLFRTACQRGWLVPTGMASVSHKPSRKGAIVRVYRRAGGAL